MSRLNDYLIRHLVSISTIENVVNQLTSTLHRPNTRSLDSLLTNLAAEADQDELLNVEQLKNIEEETDMSIQEKTKKMLNLSDSEIELAQLTKNTRSSMLMSDIIKSAKSTGTIYFSPPLRYLIKWNSALF